MDSEQSRFAMAAYAIAGAIFWGLYKVGVAWRAGQPPSRQQLLGLAANIMLGIAAGALAAFFLGPAIAGLIPIESFREPHALGFIIGAAAWEITPFAFRKLKTKASEAASGGDEALKEEGQ